MEPNIPKEPSEVVKAIDLLGKGIEELSGVLEKLSSKLYIASSNPSDDREKPSLGMFEPTCELSHLIEKNIESISRLTDKVIDMTERLKI